MLIYSVTCYVKSKVASQWEDYFVQVHLDDVINSGCFTGYSFKKIDQNNQDGTISFTSDYYCSSQKELDRYNEIFAPALKEDILSKFSGQFTASRKIYNHIISKNN